MEKYDVYCYGMIAKTVCFLLDKFPEPDNYLEVSGLYEFPAAETGTCATVLSSLGADVKIDGTHIGRKAAALVREFYRDKSIDLSSLTFDEKFAGVEDFVILAGDTRTPMGTYGQFFRDAYKSGVRHWNAPKEEDIANCRVAAIDDCFGEESRLAAEYCVKYRKPYVTIDCQYDRYVHQHAAVTALSGEWIRSCYPGKTFEEIFPLFAEKSDGLTMITNGGKPFIYARKNEPVKTFTPFQMPVAGTLGAGDSFKAGCVWGLLNGMPDDALVRFASACAAVAITRYPLHLHPPKLSEIKDLLQK